MDKTNIVFSLLAIVCVICIIIALVIISKSKIKKLTFTQTEIPNFSIDLTFDPFPQTVNIENQYDCNVDSLRVCDINDNTTLFGCRELIVRCHHFENDTPYVENGETRIIPKNDQATEGYALAITTVADACNPYHGDMTLVAADADSVEYMLVCSCKNPGYIGNESLLGNCTSVFICNGKIDDIDKPLNEIKCVCTSRQTTMRYDDGLPVCKDLLVHEANDLFADWANIVPWNSDRQINTSAYNPTIAGNLKTSRLLDPCRNSIHNTEMEIENGAYNTALAQCIMPGSGYPIVNGLLNTLSTDKDQISISAVLQTGPYERIRFSDNLAGQRKVHGLVVNGMPFSETHKNTRVVLHPQNGINVGAKSGITLTSKRLFVAPVCKGSWPSYKCTSIEERDTTVIGDLAISTGRACPGSFLWNKEEWNNTEFMVSGNLTFNPSAGFGLNTQSFMEVDRLRAYGVQWSPATSNDYTGILYFPQESNYTIHKQTVTPYPIPTTA